MTKRLLSLFLVLALCVVLPSLALADDDALLTVKGSAMVSINPDFATITLGYAAENAELMTAQSETTNAVDRIIKAVTALGVESQDIVTSNFSIGPVYNYGSYSGESRTITGYRVENMLTITVKNIEDVAAVMNAALEAGANQSYGVQFSSTKSGEAYRRALKEAILIAQEKALAMTEAAGVTLGKLVDLKEVQDYYYASPITNVRMDEAKAASGIGDTIMTGALQVTANVELQYVME